MATPVLVNNLSVLLKVDPKTYVNLCNPRRSLVLDPLVETAQNTLHMLFSDRSDSPNNTWHSSKKTGAHTMTHLKQA